MRTPSLSAPDIISLIEACSKFGVKRFKAAALEFSFAPESLPPAQPYPALADSQTQELLAEIRNDHEWLTQDIPAPRMPEVE